MAEREPSYPLLRAVAGQVMPLWHALKTRILPWAAVPFGMARNPHQITERWPDGQIPLGPKVAIFAHFDRAGAVRPYVLEYVTALQRAGLSVVFVSNSKHLHDDALTSLRPLCAAVIVRRNIGYDFGALREALEVAALPRAGTDMLLLVNDSVYGPLRDLDDLLAQIDFTRADVWGATDSWQSRYHLQSFFLAVGPAALASPAWRTFWSRVRPIPSKTWIIQHYEIGLSQALLRGGQRCAALWPYENLLRLVDPTRLADLGSETGVLHPMRGARAAQVRRTLRAAAARQPLNPTSDLWRQLLQAGFPFLKRELLRTNPTRVADVADWRDEVQTVLGCDTSAIDLDLQRTLRNRAP